MEEIKSLEKALNVLMEIKDKNSINLNKISEKFEYPTWMIKRYLKTFKAVGIPIIHDNKGNYTLKDTKFFHKDFTFTENHIKALILCKETLRKNGLTLYSESIEELLIEINKFQPFDNIEAENILFRGSEEIRNEELPENYKKIKDAINDEVEIIIDYIDSNQKESHRRIRPLVIINFERSLYLKSFCTKANDFRDFKIIRISSVTVTSIKFNRNNHKIPELEKSLGFITSGQEYDLKLKIKNPIATTIMEKQWLSHEKKYWEDFDLIYEAKVRGEIEIIRWILEMKDSVTIIQPIELKNKVKEILMKMIENI